VWSDDPYLPPRGKAHLNERANAIPAWPRKSRTCAGRCG
jgi:hypothetical protein